MQIAHITHPHGECKGWHPEGVHSKELMKMHYSANNTHTHRVRDGGRERDPQWKLRHKHTQTPTMHPRTEQKRTEQSKAEKN